MSCSQIVNRARKVGKKIGVGTTDHDLPFQASDQDGQIVVQISDKLTLEEYEKEWAYIVESAYPNQQVVIQVSDQRKIPQYYTVIGKNGQPLAGVTKKARAEELAVEHGAIYLPVYPDENPQPDEDEVVVWRPVDPQPKKQTRKPRKTKVDPAEEQRIASQRQGQQKTIGQAPVNSQINGEPDVVAARLANFRDDDDFWASRYAYELDSSINQEVSFARSFFLSETGAAKMWYGTGSPALWRDSVSGSIPTGIYLEDAEGTQLFLQLEETGNAITVARIFKKPIDKGKLGHQFMKALKTYADLKQKKVAIVMVANQQYFSRYSWLKPKPDTQEFHYDPNTPA